jgi:signal transduction histidine kinase
MTDKKKEAQASDLLAVVQQAVMGIIVADRTGKIKYSNPWADQMTGLLFAKAQLEPDNILELLEIIALGIAEKVAHFSPESGFILTQQTVELEYEG